jgi:hypothetical protein
VSVRVAFHERRHAAGLAFFEESRKTALFEGLMRAFVKCVAPDVAWTVCSIWGAGQDARLASMQELFHAIRYGYTAHVKIGASPQTVSRTPGGM